MNKKELLGHIRGLPDDTQIIMVDGSDFDVITMVKKGVTTKLIEPIDKVELPPRVENVEVAEETTYEDQGN